MSHKKRILLIEDEEDIAALIKLQAEASGYKMHVEVDGVNGYRAIEREKPRSRHSRHHASRTKWIRRLPKNQKQ